ncbi:MAG: HAD family hydrolase [Steroidobacteraceae bacterium]
MLNPWQVHTVVFDLDDTLYPERDFVLSGFAAVDRWLRANHDVEGFESQAQALFAKGQRGRIFDQVLEILPTRLPAELVPTLVEVYRSHQPQLRLFADAEDALTWIATTRLHSALITDGIGAVQRGKIEALGLCSRIGRCIVTDELGGKQFWKPHQEAFRRIMAAYPGPTDGYLYVADNPRKDFIAPHQLGWRTLRLRRAGTEHAEYEGTTDELADGEISTLASLPQFLLDRG